MAALPPQTLIQTLDELRSLNPTHSPLTFSALLDTLELPGDMQTLEVLLSLFREDAGEDVMFSLVHAVETYPSEAYVASLLRTSPVLASQAPSWLGILFIRLFNSENDTLLLESALKTQPDGIEGVNQAKRLFPERANELDALVARIGRTP